jgi:hypothetical protein
MRDKVLVVCLVLIGTFIVSVGYQQANKEKASPQCHSKGYVIPDEKFEEKQNKVVLKYAKLIYNNGKIR